jgi:hypothetical protein
MLYPQGMIGCLSRVPLASSPRPTSFDFSLISDHLMLELARVQAPRSSRSLGRCDPLVFGIKVLYKKIKERKRDRGIHGALHVEV